MGEKGWGVPTWPKQYGGGGLTPAEARVLQEEMARIGAINPIGGMGVIMFGPTLLEYGTDEQLQKHIPPIVRADLRWCQGYSEPGSGSDLASLQTKAEDKGDHFLINGQKIWTSGAQFADMCFCLVRTDPKAKKHEGISFVMIDMHQPGVEARPIRLINDSSPFCETFFTDVKVPKENLMGPLNGGWTVAKRLLQHERQGISGASGGGAQPGSLPGAPLKELARAYVGVDDDGRLADADLRLRLTQHLMEAKAFALTGQRAALENRSNRGPSTTSSVLKNVGSKVRVDAAELAVEILGHQGLGWGGEDFTPSELEVVSVWLRGKAGTIAGGSYEVQNNIIAKRILGLPDRPRPTPAAVGALMADFPTGGRAEMADFGASDLDAFRTEARAWLEANFPASLRRGADAPPADPEAATTPTADADLWRQRMGEKGWGAPTWPAQYGGGGLTPAEARVLQEEMNRIGARNPIGGMGVIMFGPTLLEYGNDEQLQRHIPPIVNADLRWCQGYSEPGAGSDLASLQTKAEDKGDHFLVNGQKIWTSGAQFADWCFCLVRTDPKAKKHEGISFLLIDMKSPGVEPRPIRLINDTTPFCETFFTDVKVPKENLMGPLNGGWTIAKRLLQFERQGIGSPARAGQAGPGRAGRSADQRAGQDLRRRRRARPAGGRRPARAHRQPPDGRQGAHALTGERIALEAKSNRGPSATSSIMKNAGTMLRKEKAELAVEIMGSQGIGWGGDGFSEHETNTIRVMLRSKSGTIAGGSQEVQNNIISKRILGLPDTTHST